MKPRGQDQRPLSELLISIVMPVYNERCVLETLAQRVTEAVRDTGARHEIVFVNDGSHDGGDEVLDRLAAEDESIRVVHLTRNFGHQAAVQAGMEAAHGDAVVLMDSDMQDDPAAIGRFVQAWREGYDVVYALRVKRKEALWKRLLFSAFHRLLSAISTTHIPADAGNFALLDRRVVREITAMSERDRYLPGLRSWVGFRQRGIEVERNARYDDSPRISVWGLWRLSKTAVFSFSSFPLSIFYGIGYSALTLFVCLGGYSLYCKLFTDLAIPGWTSHILSGSFFGALNALGICILGEYVTRIYDQVRARPLYLIDRTVNFHEQAWLADQEQEGRYFEDPWDDEYLGLLEQAEQLLDEGTAQQPQEELSHDMAPGWRIVSHDDAPENPDQ